MGSVGEWARVSWPLLGVLAPWAGTEVGAEVEGESLSASALCSAATAAATLSAGAPPPGAVWPIPSGSSFGIPPSFPVSVWGSAAPAASFSRSLSIRSNASFISFPPSPSPPSFPPGSSSSHFRSSCKPAPAPVRFFSRLFSFFNCALLFAPAAASAGVGSDLNGLVSPSPSRA